MQLTPKQLELLEEFLKEAKPKVTHGFYFSAYSDMKRQDTKYYHYSHDHTDLYDEPWKEMQHPYAPDFFSESDIDEARQSLQKSPVYAEATKILLTSKSP